MLHFSSLFPGGNSGVLIMRSLYEKGVVAFEPFGLYDTLDKNLIYTLLARSLMGVSP